MTKRYMSGITFYDSYDDAERAFAERACGNNKVLERHEDGRAAIVTLQNPSLDFARRMLR